MIARLVRQRIYVAPQVPGRFRHFGHMDVNPRLESPCWWLRSQTETDRHPPRNLERSQRREWFIMLMPSPRINLSPSARKGSSRLR
jgi:hypothetical protein